MGLVSGIEERNLSIDVRSTFREGVVNRQMTFGQLLILSLKRLGIRNKLILDVLIEILI